MITSQIGTIMEMPAVLRAHARVSKAESQQCG
jgi:hypothetical protein